MPSQLPICCHNRYLDVDISAFEAILPNYRQSFWEFTHGPGYRGMAHGIGSACRTASISPPPNREQVNALHYQYAVDKYVA
jgi:hypothetical protein